MFHIPEDIPAEKIEENKFEIMKLFDFCEEEGFGNDLTESLLRQTIYPDAPEYTELKSYQNLDDFWADIDSIEDEE